MANEKKPAVAAVDQAITWSSRVIAIMLLMMAPGILGYYLDKRWETGWLTPTGFALGIGLGIVGLLAVSAAFQNQEPADPTRYRKFEDDADRDEDDGSDKKDPRWD